jgi:hypothetical protein
MEFVLNPFEILRGVQQDYLTYVRTFQRFQDEKIRDWVLERVEKGTLLWKPPYVQISRPFAQSEALQDLVAAGLLHPKAPAIFRRDPDDPTSPPVDPYYHQTEAIRKIIGSPLPGLGEGPGMRDGNNVVVATGTGSGKSFTFGIPIVSTALRQRDKGVQGIKAVIVYPMNALANSQYDDFARRLHGSGLRIALYTGDTAYSPPDALAFYRQATGREVPFDSEVLSREEIQSNPPDILMTNYVMLELILTRFEDRRLFAHPGVLQFLVLDEVHTYSGKRGADVAALVRRLKQHTGTVGTIHCIATSATVAAEGLEGVSPEQAVADFVSNLFGEPFDSQDVITESYAPISEDLSPQARRVLEAFNGRPQTLYELSQSVGGDLQTLESQLQDLPGLPPKIHAFFSQGRAISACLDPAGPHLNDRGDTSCPVCANEDRERSTFPLVFCRACGQEYHSVAVDEDGRLYPAELDALEVPGRPGYLYTASWNPEDTPENWLTPTGRIQSRYQDVQPEEHQYCPLCNLLDSDCAHPKRAVTFIPVPFLFCPSCGIIHDRRSREYNKLFTFGSVGRSTATDVLVNAQIRGLPSEQRKVIAFSDNRQDTALQAAHMNSLHQRFAFRRALFHALLDGGTTIEDDAFLDLDGVGFHIYSTLQAHVLLPDYRRDKRKYGRDPQAEKRYQRYLQFVALGELRGTHRRTHQNLEDVGLLSVGYLGLDEFAADPEVWKDTPLLADLLANKRYDLLLGFLDLMRKRLAVAHEAALNSMRFQTEVLNHLNEEVYIHEEEFLGPVGYSDEAPQGRWYTVYRLSGTSTQLNIWVRKALGIEASQASELIPSLVAKLGYEEAAFLMQHTIRAGYQKVPYPLWMINPGVITLQADTNPEQSICPRCLTVHRFLDLDLCTGSTCRTSLERRDLSGNYFRRVYSQDLDQAVPIHAEEHSGQVPGQDRREIEIRFRDPDDPLNVIICTPTMELGIDIGQLSAVTMRNVPPSPSNYAQRAGRAGRSGQASLITTFAGVGSSRGPHDQYFYRFPEKMIAGAIAAPRFRLDNQHLIRSHIRALVLEVMGLQGGSKLPSKPRELLNLDNAIFPLFLDLETDWRNSIERHFHAIVDAVSEAFADEIRNFEWLTPAFVEDCVRSFVDDLDRAMDRWRVEYQRLDEERENLNSILGRDTPDSSLNRRRQVIESKLATMREGEKDWYIYRYLGAEGFLPGYAFPPRAIHLSFDFNENDLNRDPAIALTEYAPGNFVYYRGERYEITHARPATRQTEPDTEPVLVCPACQRAYVGAEETKRSMCYCGQDLSTFHPRLGLDLCDMFARSRARITADEEERMRLGYEDSYHHRPGGRSYRYSIHTENSETFGLTIENDGQILLINQGGRQPGEEPQGFTLCRKCFRWLVSEDAERKHISDAQNRGDCPQAARAEDLLHGLWLTHLLQSDLAIFDVPMPDGVDPEEFYTTLGITILRALLVAFNLDENELNGFNAPSTEEGIPYRIILYEKTTGGSGVLASLAEPGRLQLVFERACELLHQNDPEGGCEKACYECLLSFYNQRYHHLLNRKPVLKWLNSSGKIALEAHQVDDTERLQELLAQCQSDLERQVLTSIADRGIPLPDEAQKTIYDTDGGPLAIADFFYAPKVLVFVDGSPHYKDYVQAADENKRRRLRGLGYRVLAIKPEQIDLDLDELEKRV